MSEYVCRMCRRSAASAEGFVNHMRWFHHVTITVKDIEEFERRQEDEVGWLERTDAVCEILPQ